MPSREKQYEETQAPLWKSLNCSEMEVQAIHRELKGIRLRKFVWRQNRGLAFISDLFVFILTFPSILKVCFFPKNTLILWRYYTKKAFNFGKLDPYSKIRGKQESLSSQQWNSLAHLYTDLQKIRRFCSISVSPR